MAEKLKAYFDWVAQNGGLVMKMRLAMKTSLSSDNALSTPDSPELLSKFHAAAKELIGKEPPKF